MHKMRNLILFYFVLTISQIPLSAIGTEADQEQKEKKSILLYFTSPVTGYNTITGLSYNLTPFGIEIPTSKLTGLRFEPHLAYYSVVTNTSKNANNFLIEPVLSTAIQDFSFSIIFPFYFNRNKLDNLYNGFYISPIVASGIGFFDKTFHFGAGAMAGYSWNLDTRWHFNVGLGLGYAFTSNHWSGGLDLGIGYWL